MRIFIFKIIEYYIDIMCRMKKKPIMKNTDKLPKDNYPLF